jgi:hypothetical protein
LAVAKAKKKIIFNSIFFTLIVSTVMFVMISIKQGFKY